MMKSFNSLTFSLVFLCLFSCYAAVADEYDNLYSEALTALKTDEFDTAIDKLSIGAINGHPESQNLLMEMAYSFEDYDTSLLWLRRLASQGYLRGEALGIKPLKSDGNVKLQRGSFKELDANVQVLSQKDSCLVVTKLYGWDTCKETVAMLIGVSPEIQLAWIDKPNSDGFVDISDWENADRDELIGQIEDTYREQLRQQAAQLETDISLEGWRHYPTLDRHSNIMSFAIDINWGEELVTNIRIIKFDRFGYIGMSFIQFKTTLNQQELETLIDSFGKQYNPSTQQRYADFQVGDKIASAGAIGILAKNLGVKWNKTSIAAGVGAVLLAMVKKMWFVLFLPFIFTGRLFTKKEKRND